VIPQQTPVNPWFLDMAKISIPFFALPEMNPKLRYEMIGPEFILKKVGSYKMIRPAKNTLFTKWHG